MGLTQKLGTIPLAIQTDSSNNVGIGGAANASYKLAVTGASLFTGAGTFSSSVQADGSSNGFLINQNGGAAGVATYSSNTDRAQLAFKYAQNFPGSNNYTRILDIVSTGDATGGGAIRFLTTVNNSTPSASMYISPSGNVGIGTNSPIGPLDIAVPATGSAIGATNAQQAYDYSRLRIKHYTDSNLGLSIGYAGANYTYIQACYNQGTTAPLFLNPFGSNISIGNNIDAGFRLYVKHPTAGQYIEAGTTSAHSSFQVNDFTGGTTYFRIRGDGYLQSLTTYNNTTAAGANVSVSSSGYFERSTSSIKYKKDVRDYNKGLAEVMAMRPVYYKGKGENDGDKQFAGLIAEEIDELGLTEFVQYAEDKSPDSLYYANMIALLTKAIQELNAKVTVLENK